jgi:hypothetical protein
MSENEPTLDPADKELFLRVWNLTETEITDEEILLAINLGML